MRTLRLTFALVVGIGIVAGCGEPAPEFGDKKEDWKKTTPPPEWKGPGQPGAPSSGPVSGPPQGQ